MFYLIAGIVELVSIAGLAIFHSGMITNICGLTMFITVMMIPLANFMAVARSFGHPTVKLLLALTSVASTLFVLLGLYHKVDIPDVGLRLMLVYVGISSILIYVDKRLHPGHRVLSQEQQDTLR
jgi:hypothetical protein